MKFIKITVQQPDIDSANQWVVENSDPNGQTTFIFNSKLGYSEIAIQDDGSDYTEAMKSHFPYEILEIKM